jgi:dTDP-4-amino-4,6-dideoxygalactose transaminase
MRDTLLQFAPPVLGEEEIAEVVAALRSGWITTGPRTRLFEQRFAEFTGAAAALALSSGTAALHLALAALGVGKGSVVIAPAMNFCAGIHAIEQTGARAVLADVEPDTLNIDPAEVERAACSLKEGERLAAIMPVHLYGHPYDRASLLAVAQRHGCAIVEDAAHALPARISGKMIGARVDTAVPVLTAFSFYATKNMTTGEGGMLTGPPSLINEARPMSLHGIDDDPFSRDQKSGAPWFYEVTRPGFKYNMSDLQAAIGLAQLAKLPGFAARRAEIAARYTRAFAEIEELEAPPSRRGIVHAWHIYAVRLNIDALAITRNEFISELRRRNIAASVHFIPVHLHPWWRKTQGYQAEDFPVAYREYERLVSLPIHPGMTDSDIDDVTEAVTAIVTGSRKVAAHASASA